MLERERLFVELPLPAFALPLPCGHIGEVLVVAKRLALRRLAFDTEVAAARFPSFQSINAHELAQLDEVSHAAGLFERLVQFLTAAGNIEVFPIFLAQCGEQVVIPAELVINILVVARI